MTMTSMEAAQWTEVTVTGIGRGERTDREEPDYLMLLDERDGERRLPIWIGPAEATVLALAIQSVEMPRPFPYKLAAGLVEAAGSRITEVRITKLTDSVFYAVVEVLGPTGPREVDARPSDAVNLAAGTGAPIRMNAELFSLPGGGPPEKAGWARSKPRSFGIKSLVPAPEPRLSPRPARWGAEPARGWPGTAAARRSTAARTPTRAPTPGRPAGG
jgi:uncharacterized protein